jgi:hypothetical protein
MKPLGDEGHAEKLLTYRATADALGMPYYKVQRAARAGLLPTYRLLNGRRLLKLTDVVAIIDGTREGGERLSDQGVGPANLSTGGHVHG